MSSLAASPRISKPLDSGGHHHSQVRQLHSGPIPTQHFDFSSSVLQAATVAALTPSGALASSAGYFGFMAEPGDAAYGSHSTKNWSPASSSIRSTAARSPLPIHLDNPPQMFQKQTEVLAQKLQRAATTGSLVKAREKAVSRQSLSDNDYFSSVRAAVPAGLDNPDSEPWPPVSAPVSLQASPGLLSPTNLKLPNRSMTLPNPPKDNQPALITPNKLSELITRFSTNGLLLLDVRTYKSFSEARINTAVNLCIPTTLLKRPSFNVAKLSETFANNPDKERFGKWKQMKYIVVYDADSRDATETSALAALHTLNKFSREGWGGSSFILKGMSLARLSGSTGC